MRILVFGDSNAFRPDNSNCWPALLENEGRQNLNVYNESCDGRTSVYDMGERHGLRTVGRKLSIYSPLNYIILMLGTNDVKQKYGPPDTSEIVSGITQIIDFIDLNAKGALPVLMTPPPMGNVTSGELIDAQSRIPPIVAEYRLLAMNRDIRLVDIYTMLDIATDLQSDMIHLNADGRQKVAAAVWENLQDVMPPPQVDIVSVNTGRDNSILNWKSTGTDAFYFRVRRKGRVLGRTFGTSFTLTTPDSSASFTVEAVDFSQNTGMASKEVRFY